MRHVALAVATCLGAGYAPFAPGTVGSAVGLLVYAAVRAAGGGAVEAAAVVVVFAVGVWASSVAERHFGRTDPGPVVVDEVAGMLVTLLFVPVSVTGAILAFLLFRVFDVVKPYPANRLERLHGGFGIMADDVMAGVYANVVLRGAWWLAPGWIVG
ncbi:MAG: phosphatidylglycerophosphatase A [Acidobacteria bacterium]|nr:phosphatidylglycerophosphatase A [Acidobacteriota bacterium]